MLSPDRRMARRALALACITPAFLACADGVTSPAVDPALGASFAQNRSTPGVLATVAWQEQGRSLIVSGGQGPTVAVRTLALLAVAQYGAVVEADSPGNDEWANDAGNGDSPALRGAVAGASAQLLSFIFPSAASALELRLRNEMNAYNAGQLKRFARGVDIGRAWGNVMIDWAKADGFTTPWLGEPFIPVGPGFWFRNPGNPPAPIATPQFSAMRPYFLTSNDQFKPANPPAFGSAEFLAALAQVSSISATRTAEQLAQAIFWNLSTGTITALGHWDVEASQLITEGRLGERAAAHVFALTNAATLDAVIGCWEAKFRHYYIRPSQANPAITLPIGLPNHSSYPSGHSCVSAAAVQVITAFFPHAADALNAGVAAAGMSRIFGGIHYSFDVAAGQTLGRNTANWALRYDREHGLLSAVSPD